MSVRSRVGRLEADTAGRVALAWRGHGVTFILWSESLTPSPLELDPLAPWLRSRPDWPEVERLHGQVMALSAWVATLRAGPPPEGGLPPACPQVDEPALTATGEALRAAAATSPNQAAAERLGTTFAWAARVALAVGA